MQIIIYFKLIKNTWIEYIIAINYDDNLKFSKQKLFSIVKNLRVLTVNTKTRRILAYIFHMKLLIKKSEIIFSFAAIIILIVAVNNHHIFNNSSRVINDAYQL
jgi:hypothetical protein